MIVRDLYIDRYDISILLSSINTRLLKRFLDTFTRFQFYLVLLIPCDHYYLIGKYDNFNST